MGKTTREQDGELKRKQRWFSKFYWTKHFFSEFQSILHTVIFMYEVGKFPKHSESESQCHFKDPSQKYQNFEKLETATL